MPSLAANFEEENVFTRLLFEDEEGIAHGNDWARGFMRGVHFQSFSLAGKQRFLSLRFGQKYKTAAEKPQDEGRAGRVEQGRGYLKTANRFIGNVRLRSDLLKSRSAASARLPDFVEPMKAKLVDAMPAGNWIYEIKFDGYRALALRGGNETRVLSRNEKDLGKKFPEVNDSIAALDVQDTIGQNRYPERGLCVLFAAWISGKVLRSRRRSMCEVDGIAC